eukprot:gene9990-biopygen7405
MDELSHGLRRRSQEFAGDRRSSQGIAGDRRGSQEFAGDRRSSQEIAGDRRRTLASSCDLLRSGLQGCLWLWDSRERVASESRAFSVPPRASILSILESQAFNSDDPAAPNP